MFRHVIARFYAWGQRTRTPVVTARPQFIEAMEPRMLLAAATVWTGAASPSSSPEGGAIIYFPINLDNGDVMTNRLYTVNYSITGTATPEVDHNHPATGSMQFSMSGFMHYASGTVAVTPLADAVHPEDTETVILTITSVTGGASGGVIGDPPSSTATITNVAPPNRPPEITGGGSVTVDENKLEPPVAFEGDYSDPDGDPVTVDVVNGGPGDLSFPAPGRWRWTFSRADGDLTSGTVTIRARDGRGGEATTTVSATVRNVAPEFTLHGTPSPVHAGRVYTLDVRDFQDPGVDTVTGWVVNWGDGTPNSTAGGGTAPSFTHIFGGPVGTKTVTVTATDEDGSYTREASVDVIAPPVDLVARRTGGKFGEAVIESVEDAGDPSQYLVLTNNDFEEGVPDGGRDFDDDDAAIPAGAPGDGDDDDLAKITLSVLPAGIVAGTFELVLSSPASVRLFKSDGSLLFRDGQSSAGALSVNLASPGGHYLAGLMSGTVTLWLEGLSKNTDFTFAAVYKDLNGYELVRDDVHMLIAEWTFRDGNGNNVVFLPPLATETVKYIADNAASATSPHINAPANLVTLRLDGLASFPDGSISVTSDVSSASTVQDYLEFSGTLATSRNKIGLYSSRADTSLLAAAQVQALRDTFRIGVVHNPKATVNLQGQWDDQRRDLKAPPSITWTLGNQVIKSGEAVTGTVSVVDPDPNLKYEIAVTGTAEPFIGPTANVSLAPTAPGLNGFYVTVTVKDGQGNVLGIIEDNLGRSVWLLPANTTPATLQWSRQAFAALQNNGDAVPAYPELGGSFDMMDFLELNNRISRAYATMYNKDPDAYRWAGLAAFVSSRGGQGIGTSGVGAELIEKLGFILDLTPDGAREMYKGFTGVNEAIFLDLYRQFVAFDDPNGGLAAIQAMRNENVILAEQLQAWQKIDAGRQARRDGNAALATQEFWAGNFDLAFVEQNFTAQAVFDNHKPFFLFLTNDPWFKTQLKSPVPGDEDKIFADVVPIGVNGGQANVAVKEDRWKWVSEPNKGLWDRYRLWQPGRPVINLAEVTNEGLEIENPDLAAIRRLGEWAP